MGLEPSSQMRENLRCSVLRPGRQLAADEVPAPISANAHAVAFRQLPLLYAQIAQAGSGLVRYGFAVVAVIQLVTAINTDCLSVGQCDNCPGAAD